MTERGARRVWCERLAPSAIVRSGVLGALASRRIGLLAAVRGDDADEAAALVRACRQEGVTVGLWPMLALHEGRWASELTAGALSERTTRLLDALASTGALPDELALDLEPPFELLSSPGVGSLARFALGERSGGRARLAALAAHVRGLGVRLLVAALPTVLADGPARRWQRLLATPVDALDADHVTAMVYTSLLEGYSRGALRRRDALALVALAARAAGDRPRYGLSLGAVGLGSLGDEPVYRHPAELAEEVGLATALGVRDLGLFSLCGALARPPVEPWLDAFAETRATAEPRVTARARLVAAALGAVGGRR